MIQLLFLISTWFNMNSCLKTAVELFLAIYNFDDRQLTRLWELNPAASENKSLGFKSALSAALKLVLWEQVWEDFR